MSQRPAENILLGIGFGLINAAMLAFMGFFGKLLGSYYGPIEVTFFRNLFSLAPFLIWLILSGQLLASIKTKRPKAHLFRSIIGTIGIALGMWAYKLLPVTEAIVLYFTSPLFVLVLAAIFLRERFGIYRIAAVIAGFCGIILIAGPDGGHIPTLALIVGLSYAFVSAAVDICLRWMGATEGPQTTTFYFLLFGLCATGLYWPFADNPEAAMDLPIIGLMIGLGITGLLSLLAKTQSFRLAPASAVTPTLFTMVLWGIALDYMVWDRLPAMNVLGGAALIIGSNLFITYRQSRLQAQKDRQNTANQING